ncbi:MAG TPA: four helix bundle protein [Saprospiraceae bacterium]|nr:four helix bundle protein [Saprospiraceae bacterium]
MAFENLKNRFKTFTISVITSLRGLPNNIELKIIKQQLIRSAASVGANYRAACRAKSPADFINKLKIVEEELDESMYWIELIQALHSNSENQFEINYAEANELLSITVKSIQTARNKKPISK